MIDVFSLSTQAWIVNLLLFLLFIYIVQWVKKNKNLPPGPTGLPIVGYLPFISNDNPHLDFNKLSKKYGDVIGFNMGSQYVVVINSYDEAKEALSNPALLGRPVNTVFDAIPDKGGLVGINGAGWLEQRRFSFSTLKAAGMGQQRMEDHIHERLSIIVKEIENFKGNPIKNYEFFTTSVTGHMWFLLFGETIGEHDAKKLFLDEEVRKMGNILSQTSLITFYPWILKIYKIFKIGYFKPGALQCDKFNSFFRKGVQEKEKELDSTKNETFVDKYLHEINRRKGNNEETSFTKSMLVGNIQTFFVGAAETTKNSLEWALLTIAAYPEVQAKIHKEIDNVAGRERKIFWNDHSQLPYIEATLMEIHRWRTIGPIGALRYALESTTLKGYEIPQGAMVIVNVYNIHTSPRYWDRPQEFRPERFLTENGTSVKRTPQYMPFSVGKRNCIGEILATTLTFHYFSTILQHFEIKYPDGATPDLDTSFLGLSLSPKIQPLRFIKRK